MPKRAAPATKTIILPDDNSENDLLDFPSTSSTNKKPKATKATAKKTEAVGEAMSEDELIEKMGEFFGSKQVLKESSFYGKGIDAALPQNDWSCTSEIENLPLISIGDWFVPFPCDEAACKKLIENAKAAPFGMGSKTIKDKAVRDGWEIDGSKVVIESKKWLDLFGNSSSSQLLESIRQQLTPKTGQISAKFYKLLIYEKGQFFKAHKDTQREANHFGSIVVFLPCVYSDGELVIRHGGSERSFAFSYSSPDLRKDVLKCRAVSFFADCEHEVKPLKSGFRVALTYNLFFEGSANKKPSLPPPLSTAQEKLAGLLSQIFEIEAWKKSQKLIGVVMQHEYAPLSLKPDLLKGADRIAYDTIIGTGKCTVQMVSIVIEASGTSGDDEAQDPAAHLKECLSEQYETVFKVSLLDMAKVAKLEQKKQQKQQKQRYCGDEDEEYYDSEASYDEDYDGGEKKSICGQLLSSFTLHKRDSYYGGGRANSSGQGAVRFVNDWRRAAIGKVFSGRKHWTGNEGTNFELQYQAAAMLIRPNKK